MTPLVSVLVVTYNHERFISEALASAVAQTYGEIEIIVSDDASTDDNQDTIRAFHERYPDRIVPLLGEEHVGINANANRGLTRCCGKYVAFLDGDDIWLPTKVADQVRWLEERETRVLCGHDVEYFDSDSGSVLWRWSDYTGMSTGAGGLGPLLHGGPYATVATMVRTDALPACGFDTRLRMALDHKLWLDCLLPGGEYGFVPGILARYRRHADSIMHRGSVERDIRTSLLTDSLVTYTCVEVARPQWARHCRRRRADMLADYARWCVTTGQPQEARRYVRAAVVERGRPGRLELITLGAALLPGRLHAKALAAARRARHCLRAVVRRWRRRRGHDDLGTFLGLRL